MKNNKDAWILILWAAAFLIFVAILNDLYLNDVEWQEKYESQFDHQQEAMQ